MQNEHDFKYTFVSITYLKNFLTHKEKPVDN